MTKQETRELIAATLWGMDTANTYKCADAIVAALAPLFDNRLARFEVHDLLHPDLPELVCLDCGECICNVEHGDSLECLALTAEEHTCEHAHEPSDDDQDAARAETGED